MSKSDWNLSQRKTQKEKDRHKSRKRETEKDSMHFQNRRSNRAIIAPCYFRLVEQARIDSIPAKPTMNPVASQFFGRAFKKPPKRALQEAASDLRLYKTVTCRGCVAATYITTCVYVCVYIVSISLSVYVSAYM